MAYTTSSNFTLQYPHRTVGTSAGVNADISQPQFSAILHKISSEFNRFMDVEADIVTTSAATQEANLMMGYANTMMEENVLYIEQGRNIQVQNRVATNPPSLFDANHGALRTSLFKEKSEEHFAAITVNLNDGVVTKY